MTATTITENPRMLVAEMCGNLGPTGRYAIVGYVHVCDYGGNILSRATTIRGLTRCLNMWAIPVRVRPGPPIREIQSTEFLADNLVGGYTDVLPTQSQPRCR